MLSRVPRPLVTFFGFSRFYLIYCIKKVTQLNEGVKTIQQQGLGHRVAVNQDVQEYAELAESFNQMVQELERADQVRRNLLADVSHELLTPLTVLEGNLRAMLDVVLFPDLWAIRTEL